MEQKNILVTGAARGLGFAILKLLMPFPYRIFATARSSSLNHLRGQVNESEKLILKPLDLNDFKSQSELIDEINQKYGGIDILINNAGVSFRTVVEQMDEASERLQMTTNYLGPFNLIRLVLPKMREKKSGKIINISSVSGMMAMPTMASYSASKFALEGASEALWYELKPFGIKVHLIQPGFIKSNSFKNVLNSPKGIVASQNKNDPYYLYYKSMNDFVSKIMKASLSSENDVAKVVIRTIEKSSHRLRISGTLDARFFIVLRRIIPRTIYHYILYRMLPKISLWGKNENN